MHQLCQPRTLDFPAFFEIPAARPAPNCDWQAQDPSHVILHPCASIHRSRTTVTVAGLDGLRPFKGMDDWVRDTGTEFLSTHSRWLVIEWMIRFWRC